MRRGDGMQNLYRSYNPRISDILMVQANEDDRLNNSPAGMHI
jgi:hypothetical protein